MVDGTQCEILRGLKIRKIANLVRVVWLVQYHFTINNGGFRF
jgi:hypothetical protein